MRLVYVMGMPSGGTKAAAGTLKVNGFWTKRHTATFECVAAYDVLKGRYDHSSGRVRKTGVKMPDRGPSKEAIAMAGEIFENYKRLALESGEDKCFMKATWEPLWCPELFLENGVEPLLVWRNPTDNANSTLARAELKHLYEGIAKEEVSRRCKKGQRRIRYLHKKYGWPLWEFGKQAKIEDLERAVGCNLPNAYFDPSKIRTN